MQVTDIIKLAEKEGLCGKILDTAELEFDFSFRGYCEQNLCGNFGTNFLCPPFCGTPEDLKNMLLEHKQILVLKSEHNICDIMDKKQLEKAQSRHNTATLNLISRLENKRREVALCSPQELGFPSFVCARCLSAYCINVKNMAEKCGMSYDFKDCKLSLFGFITID